MKESYAAESAKSTAATRPAAARRRRFRLADVLVLGGLGASLVGRFAGTLGVTLGLAGVLVGAFDLCVGRVTLGFELARLGFELGGALAGGAGLDPALLDHGRALERHPLGEAQPIGLADRVELLRVGHLIGRAV